MTAVIVSESAIILGALERSIQGEFENIRKVRKLSQLRAGEDWSQVLIIFDMAHAERGMEDLLAFGAANLAHCVVLAREQDDLRQLMPLVGIVGAIVLETSSLEDVCLAARMVRNGMHILPLQMKLLLVRKASVAQHAREAAASLTEREAAVLSLITLGCSNKIIARKLGISDSTVRVHVRSVLKKLGVQNRTQAALAVVERSEREQVPVSSEFGRKPFHDAGRKSPAH